MISTHSYNDGKNWVAEKPSYHGNILDKGKKVFLRFKLSSWPCKGKMEFEVIPISVKYGRFMLVSADINWWQINCNKL